MEFQNRQEAGRLLAQALRERHYERPMVLGIPRGGVVVAREVAQILVCPLDIVVTRKLGAQGHEELAIGAVDRDGEIILNDGQDTLGVGDEYVRETVAREKKEVRRRELVFRGGKPVPNISGKTAIIVDDGIATGATTRSAIRWVRRQKPSKVVLAVPVAPSGTVNTLKREVDELIVLSQPALFFAVGQFYRNFEQVSDEEVGKIIAEHSYGFS